ncbi:MAG: hypothetical protein LIP03_14785 [Bacteroidales bacterium]|nr:hypothetical protein [Bacteroidales bacterium]
MGCRGEIVDNVDNIGDTANPGRLTINDNDNIAVSVIAVRGALPVVILIVETSKSSG